MKRFIKFASLSVVILAFGGAAAYADDPQSQQRLSLQRAQYKKTGLNPTVALYSIRNNIGRASKDVRPTLSFETRYNAHGQASGAYAPAN